MEVAAAKLIGAGLAVIGLSGVGIGIGNVFSSFISAVGRNPAARPIVLPYTFLGFALVEAVALYALLIAFLVLFG
jgi:F-type H+-transporting ATPase subunit c